MHANQILVGDCVELMGWLPSGSVDMVFADPPYNLQLARRAAPARRQRSTAVDDDWDQFDRLRTPTTPSRATGSQPRAALLQARTARSG